MFNLFQGSPNRTAQSEIAYSRFISEVEAGRVAEVTIQGRKITGQFKNGAGTFTVYTPDDPKMVDKLKKHDVSVMTKQPEDRMPTFFKIGTAGRGGRVCQTVKNE